MTYTLPRFTHFQRKKNGFATATKLGTFFFVAVTKNFVAHPKQNILETRGKAL